MWKRNCRELIATGAIGSWIIATGLTGMTLVSMARGADHVPGTQHVQTSSTTQAVLPTTAQMSQWIKNLASDQYSVRHVAADKLLAAGDAAMPAMKKALASLTTPEMRHLLRQDIGKIANADMIRGPLITLDVKDGSARQVFETICKQAGTTPRFINQNQGSMPDVTIQAHNVPFWQIMQQLATITRVSPAPYNYGGNQEEICLAQNGVLGSGHIVDIEGAFAISPTNINYNRSVNFMQAGQSASQSFNIQAALLSIPGSMGPMQIQQAVLTKAVDNHGNSLLAPNNGNVWYGNQFGSVNNFSIPLTWPVHHPGTMITELTGYIPVTVSTNGQSVDLKFKAKGISSTTIAGITISISHRTSQNGVWHFDYALKFPAGGFNQNSVSQNIANQLENLNEATFLTAGGRTVQQNGWNGGGGWPQGMTYHVNVRGGKPAEIRMKIFTGQEHLKIPIHLKNIPMP